MSLPTNRELYVCPTTFIQEPNVIFLYKYQIDTKVVPLKIPVKNPFTGKIVETCFTGASTRRQGLFRYVEKSYNGSILGG